MTDFDIIYEERDNEEIASAHTVVVVPDPIIIRGGGNVTIFGLSNRYDTEFPQGLLAKVAAEEFQETMLRINGVLRKAVPVNIKWLLCGCICCCCSLGCSLWPVVCLSKRTHHSLEKVLDWENNYLYHKTGFPLTCLMIVKGVCETQCHTMQNWDFTGDYVGRDVISAP